MSVRTGALLLAILAGGCGSQRRVLTPAEAAPSRDEDAPTRVTELDSRRGFATLENGDGDAEVRALVLRLVQVMADENVSQLRVLLGHATWQPGLAKGGPVDELTRRFAMLEYQQLRGPLAQGALDAMQVRRVDERTWDVRLPSVTTPEPLFAGRPVVRVVRAAESLAITAYGED